MRDALWTVAMAGLLAMTVRSTGVSARDQDPLSAYRWTSRVLVISAPGADDPRLRAQRDILAVARAGVADRDLVSVEAIGPDPRSTALRRRFRLPDDAFRAVLVGKDGGAKLSSDEPIPQQALFSTIDAMPMRRDEMHGR